MFTKTWQSYNRFYSCAASYSGNFRPTIPEMPGHLKGYLKGYERDWWEHGEHIWTLFLSL